MLVEQILSQLDTEFEVMSTTGQINQIFESAYLLVGWNLLHELDRIIQVILKVIELPRVSVVEIL